jgi:pilus assembly protein CpaE
LMSMASDKGAGSLPNVSHDGTIAPIPRVSIQAFCDTPEVAAIVQEATGDRRMDKAHVKVHMGGGPAAVEAYRNAPTPNVIVIESAGERTTLLDSLDALSEFCDAGTKVVVCGKINDIVLYRALIARGVSEYLVTPFSVLDFIRSISHLYSGAGAAPVGRTLAVVGAKGGVGASTIAHNLGWGIAKGLDVATVILDLDLGFGTAGLDFNQDPPQGIADAVFAPDRLDLNVVDRLLSKCTPNLSLLAAPATLDRLYDFSEKTFDPLLDILRTTVPYIVLDVPHMWTAWTKRLLVAVDDLVIVANPDLANLRNTKNLIDTLRTARPNDARPKLVLNGVGVLKRPEISTADFAKAVEVEPSAIIPFDAKLFGTAANNGQMIAEVEANGKVAELMAQLVQTVTGRTESRKAKRAAIPPWMAKLGRKRA